MSFASTTDNDQKHHSTTVMVSELFCLSLVILESVVAEMN